MKSKKVLLTVILALCLYPANLFACNVVPDINGFSTATEIFEGEYEGWYYYEIKVDWNLNRNISHWDLILQPGCAEDDHLIEGAGGISNDGLITWLGYFEREGDKSMKPDITEPVVKYEPCCNPGRSGSGTFWFYSNIEPYPDYYGPYEDAVAAKAWCTDIYGPLEGAYPSCNVSPEPTTVLLLGAGSVLLVKKRY